MARGQTPKKQQDKKKRKKKTDANGEEAHSERKSSHSCARGNPVWEDAFLARLRIDGLVTYACKAAGVERRTVYARREKNEEFAEKWDEARDAVADKLEKEAIRRAHKGIIKGVYYKGTKCDEQREYSDALIMFLLKKMRPEFREWQQKNEEASKVPDIKLEITVKPPEVKKP